MVRAVMIVEMMGAPGKYVKESLSKHIMILNQIRDIKVNHIKVSEPAEVKDSKGLYTCFAEADFETETLNRLFETMFDFMPSSIEVIEPSKVNLDSHEATALLNNLSGRLHRYDELAKMAKMRIDQLTEESEKNRRDGGLGQKEIEDIRKKDSKKKVNIKSKKKTKKK